MHSAFWENSDISLVEWKIVGNFALEIVPMRDVSSSAAHLYFKSKKGYTANV